MNMNIENKMLPFLCRTISMRPVPLFIDFPSLPDKLMFNLPVPEQSHYDVIRSLIARTVA